MPITAPMPPATPDTCALARNDSGAVFFHDFAPAATTAASSSDALSARVFTDTSSRDLAPDRRQLHHLAGVVFHLHGAGRLTRLHARGGSHRPLADPRRIHHQLEDC